MQLKSKTKTFLIAGSVVVGLLSFAILSNGFRTGKSSAAPAPSISYLESDGSHIIVHAKNDKKDDGQLVYCVTTVDDAKDCEWDNADEFELESEGDYYFFVKSLSSGKISESKLKTYKIVDYSEFRM